MGEDIDVSVSRGFMRERGFKLVCPVSSVRQGTKSSAEKGTQQSIALEQWQRWRTGVLREKAPRKG